MKSKGKITAAELMKKLNADPDWVARKAAQDQLRLQRSAEFQKAAEPIVAELQSAGIRFQSLSELANTAERYEAAIPTADVRRPNVSPCVPVAS